MKSYNSYRYERVDLVGDNLKYKGDPSSSKTVGVFIVNRPLNPDTCYFEVEILNTGLHGNICVGLCTNRSPLDKHVGHTSGTAGIMTGDGRLYKDGVTVPNCLFTTNCTTNDKVGVGIRFGYVMPGEDISYSTVHVYFAKNEKEICSYMARLPPGGLFPAVSMESEGEEVCLYLGLNWLPDEDTLMLVDSLEDEWYCLHDVRLSGQVLEYIGQGETILDVGLAQARNPLNTTSHYFEIEIIDPGENCFIAIGLTEKNYPKNRLPGWDKGSIAYHADDGKVFIGCGVGEVFGPKCHKGDIMGCGISFSSYYEANNHLKTSNSVPDDNNCANVISLSDDEADEQIEQIFMDPRKDPARTVEVFFTRNGRMVGMRQVILPFGGFLPTVGMLSFHEKVRVNLKPLTG